MTSAWAKEGLHGRMESMGLTHFLPKPMTENALLAKVDELLNGSSHDQQFRQAEAQGISSIFASCCKASGYCWPRTTGSTSSSSSNTCAGSMPW